MSNKHIALAKGESTSVNEKSFAIKVDTLAMQPKFDVGDILIMSSRLPLKNNPRCSILGEVYHFTTSNKACVELDFISWRVRSRIGELLIHVF